MTPKISVIIPVYNAPADISKCIDSLMSQTLEGIEIIFVDDHRKFIEALLSLMSDKSKRNCMANAAIENSKTLVQNCIMKKWRTLMESMGTN